MSAVPRLKIFFLKIATVFGVDDHEHGIHFNLGIFTKIRGNFTKIKKVFQIFDIFLGFSYFCGFSCVIKREMNLLWLWNAKKGLLNLLAAINLIRKMSFRLNNPGKIATYLGYRCLNVFKEKTF